ncbi:MAG TPA: septal ring lytic transglycosylase RlpA family protein [Solirubrobacteraceae bacterium]|jgi:rare lipoprotein A (peptidoglycan hydrolase)
MRTFRTATTTLLALLAATTCMAFGASALAATTGAMGATGGASPAPARAKVHRTGIATWFGPGFYGQQTACGQMLTPAVVGVANRTLPCGTLVKVTFRGHALVIPVLDRGPYANHADWDLTAGAAQALDITETVRIGTRVVGAAPNTPLLGAPPVTPAEIATGGAQAAG